MIRALGGTLAAVLLLAACAAPAAPEPVELTIFGAASLRSALEEVERVYEAANPGVDLVLSTDSSAALATQIEQGAPADVFLSADTTNPQQLVDLGLASAVVPFAGNALTVIVPPGNPAGIETPADLGRAGVRVIAAGDEVPITRYATELVANLARTTSDPAGFEVAYAANVASKEDNVAAVVTKIELGEGDAALVYVTDAARSEEVEAVAVPPEVNVRATYGAVVLEGAEQRAAAQALVDWLVGADGQGVLEGFGFLPPGG
jgi:molybdate transport system substrate-binding protein